MPAAAEDFDDFLLGAREQRRVGRGHAEDLLLNLRPEFVEGAVGNDDDVVQARSAEQPLVFFPDADDFKLQAVEAQGLADGVERAEERVGDGQADHAHPRAVGVLGFGEHPAFVDDEEREGAGHGRLGAADEWNVDAVIAEAHFGRLPEKREAGQHGGGDDAGAALLDNGAGVGGGQVLAPADVLRPVLDRHEGGEARDQKGVRAQLLHLAVHVEVEAVDDGGDADDRKHADGDAQHGQGRAQLVGAHHLRRRADALFPGSAHHSLRSATAGSSRAARRAG